MAWVLIEIWFAPLMGDKLQHKISGLDGETPRFVATASIKQELLDTVCSGRARPLATSPSKDPFEENGAA